MIDCLVRATCVPSQVRYTVRNAPTEKKVRDTVSLGRRPPPLEADNREWEPLLYFEYDEDYRMTTHYSTPYLELIEEAHA